VVAASLGMAAPALAEIEEGKLVVWINGDKGYDGLQQVGDWFTEETGIPVEVAHPDSATDKFQQSAATGNGPDIFIWAHDRFGEWAQSGIISEIKPSQEVIDANYDFTWDAVTVDGKKYGYPMAVESIGLIYNKDLLPEPPASFEEIPAIHKELAKDGKRAILWDYNNTYFTWPMLAAAGGYIFGENADGTVDVSDTGVNTEGAIKGAKTLKMLIEEGVMPRGADYSAMEASFNKGETAMMINGPWAWGNLEKSGIDFGVTTLPKVAGEPSKPMVGVMAATLNSASPNKDLAVPAYYVLAPAEASSNLARYDGVRYGHRCEDPKDLKDMYTRSRAEGFGDEVKRRIMIGAYALSAGYYDAYYLKAQQLRRMVRDDFVRAFEQCDVIAGPVAPTVAWNLGEKSDDPVSMYLADLYTIPVNLAGLPGMSVPAGFVDGRPVGLHLVGPYFSEARLLNVAHQFQQHTDWHTRTPELG